MTRMIGNSQVKAASLVRRAERAPKLRARAGWTGVLRRHWLASAPILAGSSCTQTISLASGWRSISASSSASGQG